MMGLEEEVCLFCCCFFFGWPCSMWDPVSPTGVEPKRPLQWKHKVITTGPLKGRSISELILSDHSGRSAGMWRLAIGKVLPHQD